LWQFWLGIRDYQYCLLVAPFCLVWLYLIAWRMGTVAARPDWRFALLLMAMLFAWCVVWLAHSEMAQQLLAPLILWLVIAATAGPAAARRSTQPVAALWLCMPWWDYLLPALQRTTVLVTENLLRLFGIPTQVQATTITIPEGSFEIIEGCAGKKYFTVAITLAVLAGVWYRLARRDQLVLIVAAAALALLTNWIRVITIVVAGHLTDMQHYLVAKEHLTFGTVLFGIMIAILALVCRTLLNRRQYSAADSGATPLAPNGTAPVTGQTLALALLGVVPVLLPVAVVLRSTDSVGLARLAPLPVLSAAWQGPLPADYRWQPRFAGPVDQARAAYSSTDGVVQVYVNVYGNQTVGRELISYWNRLNFPGVWRIDAVSSLDQMTLNIATTGAPESRWVVAHAYRVGGHMFRRPVAAQLAYGVQRTIGRPASGIVAIATLCADDCTKAALRLNRFWSDNGAQLLIAVPATYLKEMP
jgi:EpsI family protein